MIRPQDNPPLAAYVTVLVSTAGTFATGPLRSPDGGYRLGVPLTQRGTFVTQEQAFSGTAGQPFPLFFQAHLSEARSLSDLASGLAYVRSQPYWAITRHHPAPAYDDGQPLMRGPLPTAVHETSLIDVPKSWICVEVDLGPERAAAQQRLFGREVSAEEFRAEPVAYLTKVRSHGLPPAFSRARCYWSTHLSAPDVSGVRAQLWFWLQEPRTCAQVAAALAPSAECVNLGLYDCGRLIWTARPLSAAPARGTEEGFLPGDAAVSLAPAEAEPTPRVMVRIPELEHELTAQDLAWFLALDGEGSHGDLASLLAEPDGEDAPRDAALAGQLLCRLRSVFPYASARSLWDLVLNWMQVAGEMPTASMAARGIELSEREAVFNEVDGRELRAADIGRLALERRAEQMPLQSHAGCPTGEDATLAMDLRALLGAAGLREAGERPPSSRSAVVAAVEALAMRYPQTNLKTLAPWLSIPVGLSPRAAVQIFRRAQGFEHGGEAGVSQATFLSLSLSPDGKRLLDFAVSTDQLAADFVAEHDGQLLFSEESWYRFEPASPSGGVWRPLDSKKTPLPLLAEYARETIGALLARFDVEDTRIASALENCRTSSTIQKSRSHYPHISWDVHPESINTPMGLLDLPTGRKQRATPWMYLRQITSVAPVGRDERFIHPPCDLDAYETYLRALSPQLYAYLLALAGDPDLSDGFVRFLQVALGASLVGARPPGRLQGRGDGFTFLCMGDSRAGHGMLLQMVRAAVGPAYARVLSTDDLDRAPASWPELARRLMGARMALLVAADGMEIGEGVLNMIQSAREGHIPDSQGRSQEFVLGLCTWVIAGREHDPEQLATEGVQIRVLPFGGRCSFNHTPPPPGLKSALLTFITEGAMEYVRTGSLPTCRRVEEATADRCQQGDVIQEFLEECFMLDDAGRTTREELWRAYRGFCTRMGQAPLTRNALYAELRRRGFKESRSNNPRLWLGLSPAQAGASAQRFN